MPKMFNRESRIAALKDGEQETMARPFGKTAGHSSLALVCCALFSYLAFAILFLVVALALLTWLLGRDLPGHSELAEYEPPTISRLISRDGQIIDEFARERRLFTPIERIPPLVIDAFVSAEDKSYYTHRGYDLVGIAKAGLQALRGDRLRGASTITQQVIKNFLLSSDRSIERKMKEVLLAVRLERMLDKDQILELYLNEIFLGQNSFGVTAAAQTYFNKPLADLEPQEAAYLAAIPKAPSNYHPVRNVERAIERRNFVLKEMVENGYLSLEDGEAAQGSALQTVLSGDYESFRDAIPARSYFTDEIRRQLSSEFGADEFFEGGLIVSATIDSELQSIAARALRQKLVEYDRSRGVWRGTGLRVSEKELHSGDAWHKALNALPIARDIDGWTQGVVLDVSGERVRIGVVVDGRPEEGLVSESDANWIRRHGSSRLEASASTRDFLKVGEVVHVSPSGDDEGATWQLQQVPAVQGAFVAMDVETARVLAMQGGFSYEHSTFNRATQASRQPGSAFKPIVYATALDSGYTPASILIDAPIQVETIQGLWQPKNFSEEFYGPAPLRTGIEYSRNLMTVRLASDVGLDLVAEYAERVGLYDSMDQVIANSLGAQETTLLKLVVAYAMFANGGQLVEPTLVDRVQNRWGQTIYRHDPRKCVDCWNEDLAAGEIPHVSSERLQIIDEITAYQITTMLEGVVRNGTARHSVKADFPVAGKTGTTNESRDAWFVGYSSEIVAGCFIGYDLPTPLGRRATGSTMCAPVFNAFINEASNRYGASEFVIPEGGTFVPIDRRTGEPVKVAEEEEIDEEQAVAEFFRVGTEPEPGALRIVAGGFPMSSDLPTIDPREDLPSSSAQTQSASPADDNEFDEDIGTFGSITAGGLY
ncbi:MAG: PBP1A family penicillin-binding protein [Rhodobacteraceae bacterium]|nr:PBP1A family penicillin-binding protein [Paracoccaceae bacterium]